MSEAHLRSIFRLWPAHYNSARPHAAFGLGVPDPPAELPQVQKPESRIDCRQGAHSPGRAGWFAFRVFDQCGAQVLRKLASQKESRVEEGHLMVDHVHMT
jgi:hypothetical protein